MTAQTRILDAIKNVCHKANDLFDVDLSSIEIEFRNSGRSAGIASCRRAGGRVIDLKITLNSQLVNDWGAPKLIGGTIPHEIAHLVCYLRPELGRDHDRGWKRVCIALGGSGARCHTTPLKKARRTRKAIYNINGEPTDIGLTVHRRVQAGAVYVLSCRFTGRKTRIRCEDYTGRIELK